MKLHLPRIAIIAIVAALGFTGAAHAADVGRVLLAAGDTVALRGNETIKLTFGSAIQDKDVLRTGPASNLQVRFVDESIVSMKESSELRIDEFQFSGKEDGSERAFFRLVKGGLRTVTGLIGRANNKSYQMTTTTASIGIRGTDYSATLCQGDCRNGDGSLAKDGLYGRTHGISHGTNRIDVSNAADSKTFGVNENFYVASPKSVVERLLVSPDFVSGKLDSRKQSGTKTDTGSSGGTGTEQSTTGGAAGESRPNATPEPLPQLTFVATQDLNAQGTAAVLPPANGFLVVYPLAGGGGKALFDDDQLPATFNSQNQVTSYGTPGTFPSGSLAGGSITDTGSVTLSNGQTFAWGRWTGPTLITVSGGSTISNVPLLFGTATGLQDELHGQFGGVAIYTYAGGPKPVDAGGNVGSITSTTATIDFTQQTAQLSLVINFPSVASFGSANFNVSGTGSKQQSSFNGDFLGNLSGSCAGSGCVGPSASGSFAAGTTGPNGYDFSVFGGLINGTKAGEVAFLNAYLASSFTPGAPPAGAMQGQAAYVNQSPTYASFQSTGNGTVVSGNTLVSYSSGLASGSLGSGTAVNTGSVATVDGGTMIWGRWAGSGFTVTDQVVTNVTPASGVPYTLGTTNTVMPTSGTFTYTLAGGNVANATGTAGTFSAGAFLVNFTNATFSVSTPLTMSISTTNYSLTTCSSGCTFSGVTLGGGSPTNLTGTCSGPSCSGPINTAGTAGLFVGPQAGGLAVAGTILPGSGPAVAFAGAFKR